MMSFRKSLAINFFATSGSTLIYFIVSLVIARILTPEEIGVFSIAVVVVTIGHVFREFGVGSYLQRARDLDADKVRSAMAVTYCLAIAMAICIFVSGEWVAQWFGYPDIAQVMHILAFSTLFIPLSSVALSLLTREYDAVKLAIVTAVGTTAYTVTCIGLALAGFGTLSLAWANLANILATAVAYIWARPPHMAYMPRFREWGPVLRFGGGALLTNLVKAANDAVPDVLLGKIGSARQVGLVSRANSTVHIFIYVAGSAMTFGSQTYLSKAFHAKESLEPILYRAISLVTGVGWPLLAVTTVVAEQVIVTLYGPNWIGAAPAILPLALMAAVELAFHYKTSAFNAVDRPYLAAIPLLATAALRIVLGLALFSGSLESFAWALMLATLATAPIWMLLQRRYLDCSIRGFLAMLLPNAILAGVCAGAAIGTLELVRLAGIDSALITLLALSAPTGLAWLLTLRLLSHPLNEELAIVMKNVRQKWPRGAASRESL